MFVYVLLKFDWLIIFFLEKPSKKLKTLNVFFSHICQLVFSNVTVAHARFSNQLEFSAHAEILTQWKTTLMTTVLVQSLSKR